MLFFNMHAPKPLIMCNTLATGKGTHVCLTLTWLSEHFWKCLFRPPVATVVQPGQVTSALCHAYYFLKMTTYDWALKDVITVRSYLCWWIIMQIRGVKWLMVNLKGKPIDACFNVLHSLAQSHFKCLTC